MALTKSIALLYSLVLTLNKDSFYRPYFSLKSYEFYGPKYGNLFANNFEN